jgi:hypothetical protein
MDHAAPDALATASQQHAPERSCRNCGATVHGAYCGQCGQETALALPTPRQFLKDAAGRYVALDGRMWRTLARLMFHPGYLTREYFAGRRRRYVRPARLFLVLSLVMFGALRVGMEFRGAGDGILRFEDKRSRSTAASVASEAALDAAEPAPEIPRLSIDLDRSAKLVASAIDGPIAEALKRRLDRFNALSYDDKIDQIALGVMRYGPYAMFALLPAFALLLRLAYLGRHKPYPARPRRYAEHLVFAAHSHAFFFLIVTLTFAVPGVPAGVPLAWALVYAVWSLKTVYGGGWIGLATRALGIAIAYFVLFLFAIAGLVVLAALLR